MYIIECFSVQKLHTVIIEPFTVKDYKNITKKKYFFNWKTEQPYNVYKLRRTDEETILGLVSLVHHPKEKRIEIRLLSVSIENRGKKKQYERIAGNLIAFACREAIKQYGNEACVSLLPKTELKKHYITQYGMIDAGYHVFFEGLSLLKMLNTYSV